MTDADRLMLASCIEAAIKAGFEEKHLTRNLMDTIKVSSTPTGYEIDIPAEMYDMERWWKEKTVVPTGEGSYAQSLDSEGSRFDLWYKRKDGGWGKKEMRPGNHRGWVELAILEGIAAWASKRGKGKVSITTEEE